MKYTATIEGEAEIQTPLFDTEKEVNEWLKDNDPEGFESGAYTLQGLTPDEVKEMDSQPEQ